MEVKNPYQGLMNELLEEYGLSPIETKALVKRVAQFKKVLRSFLKSSAFPLFSGTIQLLQFCTSNSTEIHL